MKKKRTVKISSRGAFYLIEELPLPYMYAFLKKKRCTIVMFDDIPYDDNNGWGNGLRFSDMESFSKSVKKVCKNGINLMIGQKKGNQALLLNSKPNEILPALDTNAEVTLEGAYACFIIDDFDYIAHAYFESETCYNEFLNFVKKKYTVQAGT